MAKDFNTILSEAQQIKNEIIEGANTALRTGTCLEDIVQRAESDEDLAAKKAITITAGNGLTGGGSLATDMELAVGNTDDSIVVGADGIKVDTQDSLTSTSITKPLSAAKGKALQDTKANKTVTIEAGNGLTGGGDLSGNRTLNIESATDGITPNADNIQLNTIDALDSTSATKPLSAKQGKVLQDNKADKSRKVNAGLGLTGGGDLGADRTIDVVSANDGITVNADNIQLNTIDNVTSTSVTKPLSANQGKVLNDKVVQVETDLNVTTDKLTELESKIQEDEDGTLKVVDEGGNIAFKVDENGANARKFNICDENGSIVGAVDFEVLISLLAKQDQLVSGKNIATINGETILEGKDIKVSRGVEDDNLPTFTVVDEQKNVAFRIDQNGMNANKYNVLDNDGNVLGVIDGSFFGGIHKDDVVINEDYRVDGESVKAKVYALRETWRNKYVTSSSKTIYWDNVDGLDANNGTTSSTPVLTFAKVKELLADGDTLLIKRGSRITSVCDFGALNGIKIDVYGNISLPNPIFDNFVQLTGWEKVSGYTNIYRAKRMYSASHDVAYKTYYMQCFIDGKRLGASITSDNSLANKISCMNYKTLSTALTYLDAHPDDACWFGGFERTSDEPSWTSGEYYWYISLSDAPSNHTIEVSNNVAISLCNIDGCKFTDIRNINHRGGVGKDGWHVGRNTIMENCNSYDQPNYGMLLQGGSWYCINCKIVSKSGSVNTQFHYFGDNPTYNYGSEYAFIGCSVILDRDNVMGSQGFGGHYTDAHTQLVTKNIYVIDCRCEGVWRCVAGYKSECFYVKNLDIVDCEAVYSANKIVIDGVKGNIKANGATFVYIDNVGLISLKVRGAVLKYENKDAVVDNAFIIVNQSVASVNDCPLVAMFKDCKFIFEKTKGSAYNFIIPNASDMTFENCCFAVKSSAKQYITNTPAVDNIHFDDCSFFGIENNITFEDSVNKCTFGNVGEMGSNFSFVDKNIVKQLKF